MRRISQLVPVNVLQNLYYTLIYSRLTYAITAWGSAFNSTTRRIDSLRHTQLLYRAKNKPLYHIFVDLEKAFDRIPKAAIMWALRRQGIPELPVRLIIYLYEGSATGVLVADGLSDKSELSV